MTKECRDNGHDNGEVVFRNLCLALITLDIGETMQKDQEKKVGIIQSSYIPWRGYFDFIDSVDLFLFLDDIQYTKRDWRNRNQIKTPEGLKWLTVPILHESRSQRIQETNISYEQKWQESHLKRFQFSYRKAPFFADAYDLLELSFSSKDQTISELNIRLTKRICEYLSISTPMILASEYNASGAKTERLIDLLVKTNATSYVSGPSAEVYLDHTLFHSTGIGLEFKAYEYDEYPQLWGEFSGAVTVLDLIANCGDQAKELMKSKVENNLAIKCIEKPYDNR